MEIDYKNYDKITIFVKRDKAEQVISNYTAFAWSVVEQKDNNRYEDIVDITFSRPHNIKNKDELQLLQVYMEDKLNEIGKLEKNKNAKSTTVGLVLGFVGLTMFDVGIWQLFAQSWIKQVWISIIMIVLSLMLIGGCAILTYKIYKKEKSNFEEDVKMLKSEIEAICKRAQNLLG